MWTGSILVPDGLSTVVGLKPFDNVLQDYDDQGATEGACEYVGVETWGNVQRRFV